MIFPPYLITRVVLYTESNFGSLKTMFRFKR